LGWRIDSRAAGGYVVGTGSICARGTYHIVQHVPIAPLPQWLIEALAPPPLPQPTAIALDLPRLSTMRANAYVAKVTAGVVQAEPGTRHDTVDRARSSSSMAVWPREPT
jgi:hypothetical protein